MISVIIGTYNGEAFIEKAIQSIINQTISPDKYELIIVDDASTDNTTIIIDNYAKMYPNQIKVIKKSVNSSVAKDSPRNIGVENATGEYIMFFKIFRFPYECIKNVKILRWRKRDCKWKIAEP